MSATPSANEPSPAEAAGPLPPDAHGSAPDDVEPPLAAAGQLSGDTHGSAPDDVETPLATAGQLSGDAHGSAPDDVETPAAEAAGPLSPDAHRAAPDDVEPSRAEAAGPFRGGARRGVIAVVPALVLVALSLWEACAARRDARSVPGDAAWHEAAERVRAGYRPGDLIVFAPEWVDPVGRLHLGDLIPLEVAARMDAARYGRIWELAIRGGRAPDTAGLAPVATEDHGGVAVRRYERAPAIVVSDVLDRLATATSDGVRPTLELAEVGFAPHRCLQVSPAPGVPLRMVFPQLPLGRELVGYAGIADVFTRRDVRSPGRLDVEIAGKIVASIEPGVEDGWVRFAAPTTPGPADVTFIARARDAGRRICFAAEARQ